ncbi:MAG: hypothetical protein ACXAD7_09920 [Candidatus Kariarchaeaceae archaeon]
MIKVAEESPQSLVHSIKGGLGVHFTDGSDFHIPVPMSKVLFDYPVPKNEILFMLIYVNFMEKSWKNLQSGKEVFSDPFAKEFIKKMREVNKSPHRGKTISKQDFRQVKQEITDAIRHEVENNTGLLTDKVGELDEDHILRKLRTRKARTSENRRRFFEKRRSEEESNDDR